MLPITAVLGSQVFGLHIWLGAQGGSQISAGREDFAGGRAVHRTLSEGFEIVFADFKVQNAMLTGDYFWHLVEIVIGGVPTVRMVRFMCWFRSHGRTLLQDSVSNSLFAQWHIKWIFRRLKSASNSLEISISWLIWSRQAFISRRFMDGVPVSAFLSLSTFSFFTSSFLRALALALAILPAHPGKTTSLKVWKQCKALSM